MLTAECTKEDRAQMRSKLYEECAEAFAYNLRHIMWELSISKSRLARATGLSRGAITRYMAGEGVPSAVTISVIARALAVTPDILLGLTRVAHLKCVRGAVDDYVYKRMEGNSWEQR